MVVTVIIIRIWSLIQGVTNGQSVFVFEWVLNICEGGIYLHTGGILDGGSEGGYSLSGTQYLSSSRTS